jgi:hypothetical protein
MTTKWGIPPGHPEITARLREEEKKSKALVVDKLRKMIEHRENDEALLAEISAEFSKRQSWLKNVDLLRGFDECRLNKQSIEFLKNFLIFIETGMNNDFATGEEAYKKIIPVKKKWQVWK